MFLFQVRRLFSGTVRAGKACPFRVQPCRGSWAYGCPSTLWERLQLVAR